MPAKDRYHDAVKRALVKDGWEIEADQYTIVLPERFLWIDLLARNLREQQTFLIEVKSFTEPSPSDALASAIGKYVVYKTALRLTGIETALCLAIPAAAFQGIWSETIGQQLIAEMKVQLMVFAPEQEEILEWIL